MTDERAELGFLDTNVVILLPRLRDPAVLPVRSRISAVTLAELSVGPLVARTDDERAQRQAALQQAEAEWDAVPFDAPAARAYGRIAAQLRAAGRKPTARAFDALIAATAIANGLPLYTTDRDGYRGIEDLDLRVVPQPGAEPIATPSEPQTSLGRTGRRQSGPPRRG